MHPELTIDDLEVWLISVSGISPLSVLSHFSASFNSPWLTRGSFSLLRVIFLWAVSLKVLNKQMNINPFLQDPPGISKIECWGNKSRRVDLITLINRIWFVIVVSIGILQINPHVWLDLQFNSHKSLQPALF
jgi:hypothetical protein